MLRKISSIANRYFQALSAGWGLYILSLHAWLKSLDRYANISHSQWGEDAVLMKIFEKTPTGFFVDIGCNHPVWSNNTFNLYLKGWRGLNIDANKKFEKKFKRIRPKDQFVQAILADKVKQVEFFFHSDSKRSSVFVDMLEKATEGETLSKVIDQTTTLPLLLQKLQLDNRGIDLLLIDAEGSDLFILEGIDWVNCSPKWILIETGTSQADKISTDPIYNFLQHQGYALAQFMGNNALFKYSDENH
jgi:FkbM family methyltransferase